MYLEINGEPACVSPLHPRFSPPWSCSQGTDYARAQEERGRVLRDHPNAVVVVRKGYCPASAALEEARRERREWEEALVRALLEQSYEK